MASDQDRFEREERARRLKAARQTAGFAGPRAVAEASGGVINENVYKAHEQARNGFTVSDGRIYADLFGVSIVWLYLGLGSPNDSPAAASEKVSGEVAVKKLLRRIDKLPEEAIRPLWSVIEGFLKDAEQPEPAPRHGQSERASRRHEVAP